MVYGMLRKDDVKMKMAVPVAIKLEVTLSYPATGDFFKSLEHVMKFHFLF